MFERKYVTALYVQQITSRTVRCIHFRNHTTQKEQNTVRMDIFGVMQTRDLGRKSQTKNTGSGHAQVESNQVTNNIAGPRAEHTAHHTTPHHTTPHHTPVFGTPFPVALAVSLATSALAVPLFFFED
jgi:hypothetical protein